MIDFAVIIINCVGLTKGVTDISDTAQQPHGSGDVLERLLRSFPLHYYLIAAKPQTKSPPRTQPHDQTDRTD